MDPKPTDAELIEILEATFAAELRNAPKQHRDKTPDCPPLSRFATAAKGGWTTEEDAHRANCRYCQLTWSGVCEGLNEPVEQIPLCNALDRVESIASGVTLASPSEESEPRRSRAARSSLARPLGTDSFPMPASTNCSRAEQSDDARIRGEQSWEDGQLVWLSHRGLAFEPSTVARCQWLDAAGVAVAETQSEPIAKAVCLKPLDSSRSPLAGDRLIVEFCDESGSVLASATWPVVRQTQTPNG